MKKLINILCAAAALLAGLWSCQEPEKSTDTLVSPELRYRVADSYELPAKGAEPFTILVVATDPWSVVSTHPDWCIISEEEGEGTDWELVHYGKSTPTSISVQYYDNPDLEDRTDQIIISAENTFITKKVTVVQKGCAFLEIPEEDYSFMVDKSGGECVIHVNTNQNWTAQVTEGEWISIEDGASGSGSGNVVVKALANSGEMRYATLVVKDRHGEQVAQIQFTQDGVQLDPSSYEIRAGFDQLSAELEVVSNTQWTVEKVSAGDTWFDILTPGGNGDGKIQLSLTKNEGDELRSALISLKNVAANEGDFVVEKRIYVKQGFEAKPTRILLDDAELSKWSSDWENVPVYTKNVGTLFKAKSRLNRSMEFGTYTFCWSNFTLDPSAASDQGLRCRHWFCFSEGCELKVDIRPADGKISFEFNTAGDGNSPSIDGYTDVDFNQPVELTYKFDPSGAEHCHVTYLVNGKAVASFDTSADMLRTVTWGAKINMYVGVDKSGSAVCEWYEYTAPMNWD